MTKKLLLRSAHLGIVLTMLASFTSCHKATKIGTTFTRPAKPPASMVASFYGDGDGLDGRRTASGEVFDAHGLTAAHRTYPFGTLLRITNPANGMSVVVRVNDRGPFHRGRDIDLSAKAAQTIGMYDAGTMRVAVEHVDTPQR